MVPQSNKWSNTCSDNEMLNPTPYKHVKPAKTPSIALDPNASSKLQLPAGEISDINLDDDDVLIPHDTTMLTKEERLEVLAIVNRELKEIEATRKANVANKKKDQEKVKGAWQRWRQWPEKNRRKKKRQPQRQKQRRGRRKKMEKKAEREVVRMKGKAKPMANTVEQPNPEAAMKPK